MAGSLDIHDIDDIDFQRRDWVVQRVSWVVLLGIVLVAASGLLGAGPLSEVTQEADDGSVTVEYERFIRHVGTTTMTVSLGESQVSDGKVELYIARDLVEGWRIENVSPAPSTESASNDWLIYEFDVLSETPPNVKLLYRGDGLGSHAGDIRAGDGDPVAVQQWIYP